MDNNKRTIQLMNKFFKKGRYQGKTGWYGYKIFEREKSPYYYPKPRHWKVIEGEVLTLKRWEKLNKDTTRECARGIHFGTYLWVKYHGDHHLPKSKVFKVFVERENVDNIIISCDLDKCDNDVKVRTNRLTLVRQVDMNT